MWWCGDGVMRRKKEDAVVHNDDTDTAWSIRSLGWWCCEDNISTTCIILTNDNWWWCKGFMGLCATYNNQPAACKLIGRLVLQLRKLKQRLKFKRGWWVGGFSFSDGWCGRCWAGHTGPKLMLTITITITITLAIGCWLLLESSSFIM